MKISPNYYAVILAGGGGTRLWPKSRQKKPKHLLNIINSKTLLQMTFERISPLIPAERIWVITHQDHSAEVQQQLPQLRPSNIIVEPQAKNTAMAMGVAAAYIHHQDPQAVIINLAADQMIENANQFRKTVAAALNVANQGDFIVSIGIMPTFPHTGLGYIRIGKQLEDLETGFSDIFVFASKGFKEKPDLVTARSFIASGEYLWNANLYCWSTQTVFEAFARYAPEIHDSLNRISEAIGKVEEKKLLAEEYDRVPNIQIDYAISEKAKNIVVIPGEFVWSDIGDWRVVYDTFAKDEHGNAVNNQNLHLGLDTQNCLIETNGRLIATVGVEDLVIVDTPDAVLICHKDKTQDVKKVVEKLKEEKKDVYL